MHENCLKAGVDDGEYHFLLVLGIHVHHFFSKHVGLQEIDSSDL